MDRDELIAKLEAIKPEIEKLMLQFGAHDPDWAPLEKVLPYSWCGGFMFMGYVGEIRMYKHGFTRHYLNLDPEGNAYAYEHRTERYFPIPLSVAIEAVFEGLTEMGYLRTTPFDEEHQLERRRRLEEAGYTIIDAGPGVDIL